MWSYGIDAFEYHCQNSTVYLVYYISITFLELYAIDIFILADSIRIT